MSKINIKKDKVPLNAYLRADPYSQLFTARDKNGREELLVTPEMFWGDTNDESAESIYLDYQNIDGRNIEVSEGVSEDYMAYTYRNEYCDRWISKNFDNITESKLYVIQGYAGCGKSTFINYLIQTAKRTSNIYIDIGSNWSYTIEPYLFFTQTINALHRRIEDINTDTKNRERIWNEFFELGRIKEIDKFNVELPNVFANLRKIKLDSTWESLTNNIHHHLYSVYSEKNDTADNMSRFRHENNNWHSVGQIDVITAVLMLIICAQSKVKQTNREGFTLIFDNLDVITNPAIPSESVVSFWDVIDGYNKYQKECKDKYNRGLIDFNIIIAVRKVLYSHIVSHLPDLEMIVNYDPYHVNICDISNLYVSQNILEHRIQYWKKHIKDSDIIQKLTHLEEIVTITSIEEEESYSENEEYRVQYSINLDAFFNHNYRAFSNLLAAFFEDEKYSVNIIPDFEKTSSSSKWQKVATLIFVISMFYRKEQVWTDLGFGCKDFNTLDYPTTFNRLILNYLYVHRYGQEIRRYASERRDIPYDHEVTLTTLIKTFEKGKFIRIHKNSNEEQIEEKYAEQHDADNIELLFERLSGMCARNRRIQNSKAYGYDANSDELWRRPIYFTGGVKLFHTAA